MSLTMSRASIPMFVQYLTNLSSLLDKAEAHAASRKIDPAALLGARLYPDMYPLTSQVQFACDFAKGAAEYFNETITIHQTGKQQVEIEFAA